MTNRFLPRALGPLMALTLATTAPWAQADADMPMQGMGPMQMQQAQMGPGWGYGPGYGPGMGMGPGTGMMGPGMGMMGPGMPRGYGPGMGQGYGMGPGMGGMMGNPMWGYGHGMGMGNPMWGYGHGMGMGMMGGYGMGMGFGRMGNLWMLNLSDEQNDKIDKIREELFAKHRDLMQQMWTERNRLHELYYAEQRDVTAIGKAYDKLADLRRQAFQAHLDADKKLEAVLTKEQKSQLRRGFHRWGMMGY